jgi:hypothetical protein
MDVIATLIEITAFDPVANANVVGRITNRNDPRATTANGVEWLPILSSAPSVGTSVFNGAFTGAGQIDLGDFVITLADKLGDPFARLAWSGADIKIYAGDMQSGNYPLIFRAVGDGATRRGRLELAVSLTTRESLLDVNLLTQSYAGTGNLEGDAGLKGTMKPWVFGAARFCRPVLLDPVRQIWQVSAYGPVQAITNVFEGGQEITSFDGDKDLATITGNAGPAQGKWWRNHQYGLFRLGSQPLYQITCHVNGDTGAVVGGNALTKVGDIIGRILSITSSMTVKASSLAALNANIPQPFDDYFEAQATVTEVMTKMLLSVGGYYTFDESGNLIFGLVRFGQAVLNLDGQNRTEPAVMGINAIPTSAPVWYLRLGAEQCHFVHDASNLPAVIANQGTAIAAAQATADAKNKTFPTSTTPPAGAIDGDQWPDSSVSPTTMRRFSSASGTWVATSNQITTANQVPYANGQTIEALRPAQSNADKTSTNTASGIAGQGAFATVNTAGYGSSLLTGFGLLSPLNALNFGSSYLLESAGGSQATLAAFKTIQGIAASITGQGGFATINSAAYGSSFLTGFGQLSPLSELFFGSSLFKESSGGIAASLNNFKTSVGIASGIAGQGGLATKSAVGNAEISLGAVSPSRFGVVSGVNNTVADPTFLDTSYWSLGANVVFDSDATACTAMGVTKAIKMTGDASTSTGAMYLTANVNRAQKFPCTGGETLTLGYSYYVATAFDAAGSALRLTIQNIRRDGSVAYQSLSVNLPALAAGATATVFNQVKIADDAVSFGAYFEVYFPPNLPKNGVVFVAEPMIGSSLRLGRSILRQDGSTPLTDALAVTSLGVSSAFAGQGAFATVNTVGYGSSLLTGFGQLSPLNELFFGSSLLRETSGGTAATLSNFKTSAGTASAIAGQGAFATVNSAGYGSSLLTGFGQLSPLNEMFFGSSLLRESTGGTAASLANFKTSLGTSSAIIGQGQWATTTVPVKEVISVAPNLLYDAGLKLGGQKWIIGTGWGVNQGSGEGAYFQTTGGTGRPANSTASAALIGVYENATYTAQCEAYTGGVQTGKGLTLEVGWQRADGTTIRWDRVSRAPGQGWDRLFQTMVSPPGSSKALVQIFPDETSGDITNIAVRRFKFAQWDAPTVFSDEATNSAQYLDGKTVDVLKPQEIGSNVTENRSAAAFTGQGSLATKSSVTYGDGFLLGLNQLATRSYIKIGGSSIGTDSFPLLTSGGGSTTDGTVITSLGSAAAFAGQGSLATKNQVNYRADVTGGQPQAFIVGAKGNGGANTPDYIHGLFYGDRQVINSGYARSYTVNIYNRTNNTWSWRHFDVYGNTSDYGYGTGDANTGAGAMSGYLNALAAGTTLVIYTSDEPSTNHLNPALLEAMYRCGASRTTFGAGNWFSHGAYILVGVAGAGEGNGIERYEDGGASASPKSIIQTSFTMIDGRPIISGKTIRTADELKYGDGTTVGSLKPAQVGANVTGTNTAAGIAGQGAFATQSKLALTNGTYFTADQRFAASTYGAGYFNSTAIAYTAGSTVEDLRPGERGSNITENRTSAAFTGQGSLATKSSVTYGDGYLLGLNQLATRSYIKIGGSNIGTDSYPLLTSGGGSTTDGSIITAQGNAAGFSGQGALATKNSAAWLSDISGEGKPSNYAGTNFTLYSTGTTTILVQGNNLVRTAAGINDFSAIAVSQESSVGNAYATFKLPDNACDAGLTLRGDNPNREATYLTWHKSTDRGTYRVRVGTTETEIGAFGAGSIFGVFYDGVKAIFTVEGTVQYTAAVPANLNMRFVGIVGAQNATIGSIQFGPYTDNLWANTGGANKPKDNADVTSANQAASIAGQADWATYSGLSTSTVSGKVQYLQTDGAMQSAYIYKPNKGNLDTFFPEDTNSNRTENRIAAAFSGQGWGATASESSANNAFAKPSANALIDTEFRRGRSLWNPIYGGTGGGGGGTHGINLPGWFGASRNVLYSMWPGVKPAGEIGEMAASGQDSRYWLPVAQGDRVFAAARLGIHRCSAAVNIHWYNAAGAYIGEIQSGSFGRDNGGADGQPENFDRNGVFGTAPSGAAFAMLRVRALFDGRQDCYIFMIEPQICKVPAEQREFPVYTSGSADPTSDRTLENTAAGFSGQGAFATVSTIARSNVSQYFNYSAFSLNYSITRSDGTTTVTENMSITELGISSGFSGQGSLATKSQVSANDIAPSAVQLVTYMVLQYPVNCPVGN